MNRYAYAQRMSAVLSELPQLVKVGKKWYTLHLDPARGKASYTRAGRTLAVCKAGTLAEACEQLLNDFYKPLLTNEP